MYYLRGFGLICLIKSDNWRIYKIWDVWRNCLSIILMWWVFYIWNILYIYYIFTIHNKYQQLLNNTVHERKTEHESGLYKLNCKRGASYVGQTSSAIQKENIRT